jgi:hypothetical protein
MAPTTRRVVAPPGTSGRSAHREVTLVPHPALRRVERLGMHTMRPQPMHHRTPPAPPSRVPTASRHEIHELVQRMLDDAEGRLGLRPDVHLDWPARTRVPASVAGAVGDALAESLNRVADHEGTTSAFVSVSYRQDTVEVCVVDDGGAPGPAEHRDEGNGVEHDVEDYGPAGTCQWWSIPTDLV